MEKKTKLVLELLRFYGRSCCITSDLVLVFFIIYFVVWVLIVVIVEESWS